MGPGGPADYQRVLALLPSAWCVMSAAFEGKRAGILVCRTMVCADEPPSVAVAVPNGHPLATLIRDSHAFALSVLSPNQRLVMKKFREPRAPLHDAGQGGGGGDSAIDRLSGVGGGIDPFDMLETRTLVTGAPTLARAVAAIDCDVMRHFDLEADHEVYVGMVVAVRDAHGCTADPGALHPVVNGELTRNGQHKSNGHHPAGVNGSSRRHARGAGPSISDGVRAELGAAADASREAENDLDPDDELQ